jgi:hypothetical protein
MTSTYSQTYTVADIRRVLNQFAADLAMFADSTGLWSLDYAQRVAADAKALAEAGYLGSASVCLRDENKCTVRAARYDVSTDTGTLTVSRPGDAMWPRTRNGELTVVLSYTPDWDALSAERKQRFESDRLTLSWVTSDIDTTFPGLVRSADRNYASNGYGLIRSTFA